MKFSEALESSSGVGVSMTAGVAFTAAQLQPTVSWILNGHPHPVPDNVSLTIAATALVLGHAVVKLFYAWLSAKAKP